MDSWVDSAACAEIGGDLWFPDSAGQYTDVGAAKTICRSCPVLTECRDYALRMPETVGIWGALTESERRTLRRTA